MRGKARLPSGGVKTRNVIKKLEGGLTKHCKGFEIERESEDYRLQSAKVKSEE